MIRIQHFAIVFMLLTAAACSSLQQQSLKGAGWYLVKPTDSLYSIAWRYGLDYRYLALWNDLAEPYVIHPGQQLVLIEPDRLPSQSKQQIIIVEKTDTGAPVVVKSLTPTYNRAIRWRWPTRGNVLNRYSDKGIDQRGIDIAGKIGQPVYCVADGKVVYSGTGLSGYGNLIIIKHNDTYLSAYAYNSNRLVQEGMQVKRGARIAEMGQGNNGNKKIAMLHFQIRKNGKPVDPLLYLPQLD